MRRAPKGPPVEVSVSDGMTHLGRAIPRDGAFEAHVADGRYLGKFPTRREATEAIARAYDSVEGRQICLPSTAPADIAEEGGTAA